MYVWLAVAARAALSLVLPIAEVPENVSAIAVVGVAEVDHRAQLTTLELATTRDVARIDAELRCGNTVEH